MPSPAPPPCHERPWPACAALAGLLALVALAVLAAPRPRLPAGARRCARRRTPRRPSRRPASARTTSPAWRPARTSGASRSSRGMCLTASAASRCSVSETGSPERRSSVTNPERRSSTGLSPTRPTAAPWWPARCRPGTSTGCAACPWRRRRRSVCTPSSTSVRAQSSVSETDGALRSSSVRSERTMRATWSASSSLMPGTLARTISRSRSRSG